MTKKKPTVKPIITGIRPNVGEKKYIKLHYHPDAIKATLKTFIGEAEDERLKMMFEDISNLVNLALEKCPLAEPPKGEEKGESDPKEKD